MEGRASQRSQRSGSLRSHRGADHGHAPGNSGSLPGETTRADLAGGAVRAARAALASLARLSIVHGGEGDPSGVC